MHKVIISSNTLQTFKIWCVSHVRGTQKCKSLVQKKKKKVKRGSSDSENVGGGLRRGWPAWWRAPCCCSCRQSLLLLRRSREWDMTAFNTHLITTWSARAELCPLKDCWAVFFPVHSAPKPSPNGNWGRPGAWTRRWCDMIVPEQGRHCPRSVTW